MTEPAGEQPKVSMESPELLKHYARWRELRDASNRYGSGNVTTEEIFELVKWELAECLYSLPPDAKDNGRIEDPFHAGCCALRALSMVWKLSELPVPVSPQAAPPPISDGITLATPCSVCGRPYAQTCVAYGHRDHSDLLRDAAPPDPPAEPPTIRTDPNAAGTIFMESAKHLTGESLEQKARQLAREICEMMHGHEFSPMERETNYRNVVEKLLAFARHLSAWVPVTERLPELQNGDARESDLVLVCQRLGTPQVAWMSAEYKWFAYWGGGPISRPTHWQPLPSPPAEEGKS